jgi:Kef-type K+ transport system membrane component KefB/Trk K+ transport system NAD-binding subunit
VTAFTDSVFAEVALLLMLAAAVGLVGVLLRQPLIVAFILVGLIAGPSALDLVRATEEIHLLSELGVAILLFLVGIKLDVKLIRSLGAVSLMTGLGQVAFTSVIGYGIGLALGFTSVESLYIAVALTFSSTIIIVKLLSDKREIDALHGQVALGFLIVQDLVVVLAMIVLSAVGIGAARDDATSGVLLVLGAGIALLVFVILFVRFVADPLTERLARSPELLICFAIALAAFLAAIGDAVGFGKELGGLMAGVALASTRYRDSISTRLAPLRDFLLLFFFIALGTTLDLGQLGSHVGPALLFSVFVLIGNPLIVLAIMGAMGYRKRTGFLAGLTVAQISEFSLIFIAMGITIGHLSPDVLGLVTLVGLITIALSTYMITYSHVLYAVCEPFLGPFERAHPRREEEADAPGAVRGAEVILFGLGRFGTAIGLRLARSGTSVLGIDFNPDAVRRWRTLGLDVEYGDASDPEFLSEMPTERARWIVSTVPAHAVGVTHDDPRLTMAQVLRARGYRGGIAVTSHREAEVQTLLSSGADLVLEPFQDAADRAVELLSGNVEPERIAFSGIAGENVDEER